MSTAPSLPQTVPDAASGAAPVEITVRTRRASLLDYAVEQGCEIIAVLTSSARHLAASRQHDKLHDQALATAARSAALHGQAAHVQRCGCAPYFDRIGSLIAVARHHDHAEDTLIGKALSLVVGAVAVVRGVNRRLDGELTKRGWR